MRNFFIKVGEYLFYLSIFLLPLQTRLFLRIGEINGGYFEYGSIALYGTDILLIIVFVLACLSPNSFQINDRYKKIWYALAGLEFFVLLSCFFATDHLLAFSIYLRFLLGIILFFLVINFSYDRAKLNFSLLLSLGVQSVLAIYQFFLQFAPGSKWFGMAVHTADSYSSVIEVANGGRWLRAYGSLDHPNILGGFLTVGVLYLFLSSKDFEDSVAKKILFRATLILSGAALFFTFSRSAWLAIFFALFILFLIKLYKKSGVKNFLSSSLLLFFIFLVLSFIYSSLILTRTSGEGRLEGRSINERVGLLFVAKGVISENIFFGVGAGNFTHYTAQNVMTNRAAYFYQPVHNVFLLIWSEIGLFGFLFFLATLILIFQAAIRINLEHLAIFSAIFVIFMLDHWWWSFHFGVLFFWFLMGILLSKESRYL